MDKKQYELRVNNTYQILEDAQARQKRKLLFRHMRAGTFVSRASRRGPVRIYTPEEIRQYERELEEHMAKT